MWIDNLNLFPLKRIGNYDGYFMDHNGHVFSTKRGGKPVRLHGSVPYRSYGKRIYTMNSRTISEEFLKRAAFAHADFKKETTLVAQVQEPEDFNRSLPNRAHATSLADGIKSKGWFIGSLTANGISFKSDPVIHLTEASVKSELERLATTVPGTKFIAVKIAHAVVANSVIWE